MLSYIIGTMLGTILLFSFMHDINDDDDMFEDEML